MHKRENRYLILKGILGMLALFLIVVAFVDFTPSSKVVEKTVSYPVQ